MWGDLCSGEERKPSTQPGENRRGLATILKETLEGREVAGEGDVPADLKERQEGPTKTPGAEHPRTRQCSTSRPPRKGAYVGISARKPKQLLQSDMEVEAGKVRKV